MTVTKTGVLLINLGTPARADKKAVRAFLKEFLSDARVVDLPVWVRQVLLHSVILPFRTGKTTNAYQSIWDQEKGSPLLFHSQDLLHGLRDELGEQYQVELGMRYGEPSIWSATEKLLKAQCSQVIIVPLFPQYSSAASGSAIA
ncbi:MAG TPA: ferrochelatase, partial [Candidatus Berkiella sp.]|nr:ferrochelatase [Candidatus Berkiella sp.]